MSMILMSVSGTPRAARLRTIAPKSARLTAIDRPENSITSMHEPCGCAEQNHAPAAVAHIDDHIAVPFLRHSVRVDWTARAAALAILRPLASYDAGAWHRSRHR